MGVKVEGLDELMKMLSKIENGEGIKQAMGRACMLVQGDAQEMAPKGDSGRLKGSIDFDVKGSGSAVEGIVYTNLEYAPYVEFGTGIHAEKGGRSTPWCYQDDNGDWHYTKGQKPKKFMRPALKKNRDKIKSILGEGLLK